MAGIQEAIHAVRQIKTLKARRLLDDRAEAQRMVSIEKMNAFLSTDDLFTADNRTASFVQELILK